MKKKNLIIKSAESDKQWECNYEENINRLGVINCMSRLMGTKNDPEL